MTWRDWLKRLFFGAAPSAAPAPESPATLDSHAGEAPPSPPLPDEPATGAVDESPAAAPAQPAPALAETTPATAEPVPEQAPAPQPEAEAESAPSPAVAEPLAPAPPPPLAPAAPPSLCPAERPGFPYPLYEVHGSQALAAWEHLRAHGEGWPVVIGSDDALMFATDLLAAEATEPATILEGARQIAFPETLAAEKAREAAAWRAADPEFADDMPSEPPVGPWPEVIATAPGLTVATHLLNNRPFEQVYIAVLPCEAGWAAPAYLHFGGWNDNPRPEHHVAALRSWHERYGAELIGMSSEVLNLRSARRAADRDEALALAREHYLYCPDIVDQGTETLAGLAASLMTNDWWFFWWD